MLRLADLKVRIGLDPKDRDDDRLLEQLEREAVAHLEALTNRYFGPVATLVDRVHGGSGRSGLVRLRAPLVSLTSVETLGSFGAVWTAPWALTAFEWSVGDRLVYLMDGSLYPRGRYNVRVTYVGGYAAGEEPADIRGAVAAIVADTYRQGRATATPVDTGSEQASPGLVVSRAAGSVIDTWRRSPGL